MVCHLIIGLAAAVSVTGCHLIFPFQTGEAATDGLTVGVEAGPDAPIAPGDTSGEVGTYKDSGLKSWTVSTFAGSGLPTSLDGPAASASFHWPAGIAIAGANKVYVTDYKGHRVRVVEGGKVTTLAGDGMPGYVDGNAATARFQLPVGVAVNASGVVFVADYANHRIRKIAGGIVSTYAGASDGFIDGPCLTALFSSPLGLAIDGKDQVLVADMVNNKIRMIDGSTVSTIAGDGAQGMINGLALSARFKNPSGVLTSIPGLPGAVLVADQQNHVIRQIHSGVVSTFAGMGVAGDLDGSTSSAKLNFPYDVAADGKGTIYVVDRFNHKIKMIAGGLVTTLAGDGTAGFLDGPATSAKFNFPSYLAVDAAGRILVTDTSNNRVRIIEKK
jgi:hypothetical protein